MQVQTAVIEAKRVFVPKAAPWLMDFQDEVTKFPAGKHDDQVDSLSSSSSGYRGRRGSGRESGALC